MQHNLMFNLLKKIPSRILNSGSVHAQVDVQSVQKTTHQEEYWRYSEILTGW
jgi:hypothetical protein